MKLPKYMTTVTTFSRLVALSMLVVFPVAAFFLGKYYQKTQDLEQIINPPTYATPTPTQVTETSCSQDSDCELVNQDTYTQKNTMAVCCGRASCTPIDMSQSNWVAKNSEWLSQQQNEMCGSKPKACPMVMIAQCLPKPINNNFEARCINAVCTKVPKPNRG